MANNVPLAEENGAVGKEFHENVGDGHIVCLLCLAVDEVGIRPPQPMVPVMAQTHGVVEVVKLQPGVLPALSEVHIRCILL